MYDYTSAQMTRECPGWMGGSIRLRAGAVDSRVAVHTWPAHRGEHRYSRKRRCAGPGTRSEGTLVPGSHRYRGAAADRAGLCGEPLRRP
jgi:hypothetical protein